MGEGFWITQFVLIVAAITIGISAERRNRAEQTRPPADAPYYRIPVEPAGVRLRGSEFTAPERLRLLMLRRAVEQARALKTDLYDDLQRDRSDEDLPRPMSFTHVRSRTTLVVWIGVALVAVGCVGVWHANTAITELEHPPTGAAVPGSVASHLLPGVIANPGKYLAAVNSTSTSRPADRDPIQVMAWVEQKELLDRFEALLGLGIAFLLAAITGWPRPHSAAGRPKDGPRASVGSDLLPFVLVVSFFTMAMSFFELP